MGSYLSSYTSIVPIFFIMSVLLVTLSCSIQDKISLPLGLVTPLIFYLVLPLFENLSIL